MAYLAVDKDGTETIYNTKPIRGTNQIKCNTEMWVLPRMSTHYIILPKGSIKKLIGKDLTWNDEPVKYD
jgi:hypothetical protein